MLQFGTLPSTILELTMANSFSDSFINNICIDEVNTIFSADIDWNKFSARTILLTGASGQFGQYLLRFFSTLSRLNSLEIVVYCINRRKFNQDEIGHFNCLRIIELVSPISKDCLDTIIHSPDLIIHAASPSDPNAPISDYLDSNIYLSRILLDKALEWNCQSCLFISTSAVYGDNTLDAFNFDDRILKIDDSNSIYAVSKLAGEQVFASYSEKYGLKTMVARLHQIYGIDFIINTRHSILSKLFYSHYYKQDLILNQPSKIVSYCHISDALYAILLIIVNGENSTTYDVIDRHSCITLADLKSVIFDSKDIVNYAHINGFLELEDISWTPRTNIVKSMQDLFKNFSELQHRNLVHKNNS